MKGKWSTLVSQCRFMHNPSDCVGDMNFFCSPQIFLITAICKILIWEVEKEGGGRGKEEEEREEESDMSPALK